MAERNPFPGENNTGHIWDGNLRELANPPPGWWTIGFWASIAFFAVYGVVYPLYPVGDNGTKGVMGWTQMGEYKEGKAEVDKVRATYESKLKGMDAKAVLADPSLKKYVQASANVLFGDYCAACHGSKGVGNAALTPQDAGFPVLVDDDWLWGGDINTIVATVTTGRKGIMPANVKAGLLTEADARKLAKWVAGMKNEKKPMSHDPEAQQMFVDKGCFACHGPDAKGVDAMGSADLTSPIWRFAPGGEESAFYTIANGVNDASDPKSRVAEMPKFGDRLSADEIKKVAIFVHQLGGGK